MKLAAVFVAAGLVSIFAACSQSGPSQPRARAPAVVVTARDAGGLQHYDDPFSYCRALGTLDRPDARYSGPNPPPQVIASLIKLMGADPAAAHSPAFVRGTYWRCMDGAVYACTVGANLPCESRADTRREPTPAENAYCAAHPDSGFIPMYVTGHATIYDWQCAGVTAAAGKPVAEVDARGFIAGIWHRIPTPSQ